jgi:hypothetical protein
MCCPESQIAPPYFPTIALWLVLKGSDGGGGTNGWFGGGGGRVQKPNGYSGAAFGLGSPLNGKGQSPSR